MTRSQRSTTTGRMPPDGTERAYPEEGPDGATAVVREKTVTTTVTGDVGNAGENRAHVAELGAAKRRHLAGTAGHRGLHDDDEYSVEKTDVTTNLYTDGQFDDDLDIYPEGGSRSPRTGHDTFRDDRREATGGQWSDEPIITRADETPASIRAATAQPDTTRATATAVRDLTDRRSPGRPGRRGVGALMSDVASDMSTLVRQEVDLAKAEIRQSAVKAGKGAGMFGAAAGAGAFAVLFLLLAVMFGLSEVMALGWAALIVGSLLIAAAAVFALLGRANVKKAHAKPEQTVETLKEDMQWAHGLRK